MPYHASRTFTRKGTRTVLGKFLRETPEGVLVIHHLFSSPGQQFLASIVTVAVDDFLSLVVGRTHDDSVELVHDVLALLDGRFGYETQAFAGAATKRRTPSGGFPILAPFLGGTMIASLKFFVVGYQAVDTRRSHCSGSAWSRSYPRRKGIPMMEQE